MDRLEPSRSATRLAARQRPRPDTGIVCGEVSWRSLQKMQWDHDTRASDRPSLTTLSSTFGMLADRWHKRQTRGIRHVPPTALRLDYIISAEGATSASGRYC